MGDKSEHAKLSASDSKRWLMCPGSIKLTENMENKTSDAADEGTLAHAFCEIEARVYLGEYTIGQGMQAKQKLYKTPEWEKYGSSEMEECAKIYAQFVADQYYKEEKKYGLAYFRLEHTVDFSNYVPEGFGTADCLICGERTLYVNDYKHGKGVYVDCKENTQMLLYAVGALEFSGAMGFEKVVMSIIQPRMQNISTWEIGVPELLNWAENFVKPRALEAYNGSDEFGGGDHCTFCPANPECRFLSYENQKNCPDITKDPNLLTEAEIAKILESSDAIIKWLNKLSKLALDRAMEGVEFPGYKLVAGRSNRSLINYEDLVKVLEDKGYLEAELWGERPPLGVGDMEKLLGKDGFKEYLEEGGFVVKPEGKPTLVPVSDKREAIKTKSVEETFKDIEI